MNHGELYCFAVHQFFFLFFYRGKIHIRPNRM